MDKTRRGLVLGGMAAATLAAAPSRYASRLRFSMDGPVTFDFVRWNPYLNPQPDFSGLPPGAEIRARYVFPFQERDVVEVLIYVPLPNGVAPVSIFYTEVEDVILTANSLSLFGKIVSNPKRSPFGDLTGTTAFFGGLYDKTGPNTRFEFFIGAGAGSHATILPEAFGSLEVQGSMQSF